MPWEGGEWPSKIMIEQPPPPKKPWKLILFGFLSILAFLIFNNLVLKCQPYCLLLHWNGIVLAWHPSGNYKASDTADFFSSPFHSFQLPDRTTGTFVIFVLLKFLLINTFNMKYWNNFYSCSGCLIISSFLESDVIPEWWTVWPHSRDMAASSSL